MNQAAGDGSIGAGYRHEQSRQFADHMLALPRQDFRPQRQAFEPLEIPKLLPRIIIRAREANGEYRYRLLGTELQSYMGHDPTGKLVTVGVGERAAGPIQETMNRMMDHPCGLRCVTTFIDGKGRTALLEYVSFPLSGASPAQQISHVAILERDADMNPTEATEAQRLHEIEGIDLGAGVADFSGITW